MPKGLSREEKIACIVKQLNSGRRITEISREHGISRATLYVWKAKYNNQNLRSNHRLRELEEENRKLKQLIGELCLQFGKPLRDVIKGGPAD